ncbi:tripartite tricarboxylate transporter substrate-binding protein [Nonomuraea turcica]|uniref:tripartite tricarboxylate transporter substrate-binding protein n=1 Tax=Nonomuraea sp. G32 TaxID=3067274 RepID=UPI00273B1627|nr:tripartite tricarboxylate transporter substrate-binding protein [Nonomuraea sp. G32]MDP4508357.1 tripartite tricarboxylate transporter substrate-binding protein [Nonomuraea sp. G32]
MRRRRFVAWGLGVAAIAAGCGTGHVTGGAGAGRRAEFSINPGGRRWDRVGQAFAGAARTSGYETGTGTRITVTGLPALAAAELNNAETLLDTATPLSRLAGDVEVVVVPANSRFKDFADFGAHLLARPGQTPLAGGPEGAPDHLLFGLIAKGLGADTRQVDYTGYPSSQEAMIALLSGKASAAAGLLPDWRGSIGQGRVRALAVSSAVRVPDFDVPTLLESGVRVDFADWTAAFGPDDMPEESRASAIRMCEDVTGSPGWRAACRAAGWISIPLSGDDFARWLGSEVERTRAVLRDLGLVDATKATTCWGSCGNGH